MLGFLIKKLFKVAGLTEDELAWEVSRNRFSEHLPWVSWDPETRLYLNQDGTVGFIWECVPLVFAGEKDFETLSGLFRLPQIPEGSVLQFLLCADPYIEPFIERYKQLKVRRSDNPLVAQAVERIAQFWGNSVGGLEACQGIPVRNFRLFVSLKMPAADVVKNAVDLADLRSNISEILKAVGLAPRDVHPNGLIEWLWRLFNGEVHPDPVWDETRPIWLQLIAAQSPIEFRWNYARVGPWYMKCLTPKRMPFEVGPLTMNVAVGDIWGVQSDGSQINVPFMVAVNVIYQDLKTRLHAKCNFVLQQKAVGSLAPSLVRKQTEYLWATGEIERGTPFVRVMPIVWVYGRDLTEVRDAAARVRRMWEQQGFIMQEDSAILKILLIAALPMGLYTVNGIVDAIDRDFICHDRAAVYVLPFQADYCVHAEPHMIFVGRKGQIISFDLFDRRANNMNAFVAAESGSGKSFLVNHIAFNYYASGGIVRIIDIGGSYRKLCELLGGKFISFSENSDIVINPFGNVIRIEDDIGVLTAIIGQMVYSATGAFPDEDEMTLIKMACIDVWQMKGSEASIDDVYEWLSGFPSTALLEFPHGQQDEYEKELTRKAHRLASNLRDFTTAGIYGRWFNGPTTLNIAKDDFVVLELEELKPKVELFRVVTLQVLNYVTHDLYLSDRSSKRLLIFDEAWQFFRDTQMLAHVIEEGYRRARKYGGSFITITQSLLDLRSFGRVGEVIMNNSAWKFFLQSSDYERAKHEKIIDYGDFEMKIIKSVKNVRPRYSEVFVDSPIGRGVMRLVVDRYTYYVYTTDAHEVKRLADLYARTGSWAKAVEEIIAEEGA